MSEQSQSPGPADEDATYFGTIAVMAAIVLSGVVSTPEAKLRSARENAAIALGHTDALFRLLLEAAPRDGAPGRAPVPPPEVP